MSKNSKLVATLWCPYLARPVCTDILLYNVIYTVMQTLLYNIVYTVLYTRHAISHKLYTDMISEYIFVPKKHGNHKKNSNT